MNLSKPGQHGGTDGLSVNSSNALRKPKVESMERRRQIKEREKAIKSILNKASAINW